MSTYDTIIAMIRSGKPEHEEAAIGIMKSMIADRAAAVREKDLAVAVMEKQSQEIDKLQAKVDGLVALISERDELLGIVIDMRERVLGSSPSLRALLHRADVAIAKVQGVQS